MLKQTSAVLIALTGILNGPLAHANCNEVLQELLNNKELTQTAILQAGGIISLQGITMREGLCTRVTQRLVNEGTLTQTAILQTAGEQYLQYILIE